jgi:hypothetical protein
VECNQSSQAMRWDGNHPPVGTGTFGIVLALTATTPM